MCNILGMCIVLTGYHRMCIVLSVCIVLTGYHRMCIVLGVCIILGVCIMNHDSGS